MIACQVGNGTSCAIFSVMHGRYEIVPAVQYFPYCTAGTKLYLLCNMFRIARQVYEIVPAVQYFPYCTAGTKWHLLCIFYRCLLIFPYCTAGTWVFASRGVPLRTRSPKGPQNHKPGTYFWVPFLNNFPPKCTCCAIL